MKYTVYINGYGAEVTQGELPTSTVETIYAHLNESDVDLETYLIQGQFSDEVLDWYEIDCYSTQEKESIIFQKNDLEYLDYTLEIETLSDKNILSANNQIFISKISFLRNFYFSLDDQEINPDLTFKSIGGLR